MGETLSLFALICKHLQLMPALFMSQMEIKFYFHSKVTEEPVW